MNEISSLIAAIEQVDNRLKAVATDDSEALAHCLERRAQLIDQVSALIGQIRKGGQEICPETAVALRRSQENGNQTLRQLIVAKHQFATHLTQLKQEERLLNDLAIQPPLSRLCDISG